MIDVQLRPGLWIYANMTKHQNDYYVGKIKRISKNEVYFDALFSLHQSSVNRNQYYGRLHQKETAYPISIKKDPYWRSLKRPSTAIKHAMVKVTFV